MTKQSKKKAKNRLDIELVNRNLSPSKERAQALIMAGDIRVNQQVIYKADTPVACDALIEVKEKSPFVSRGADKIAKAFETFNIDVKGRKTLDIGISTGGFSDYMLQKGAEIAAGVDVNINQVDFKLHKNKKLTLIKANARHLEKKDIPFEPDIITIDVSFISITKILPALTVFKKAKILTLIKPQFEVKKENVEKGGIVRDKNKRIEILLDLKYKIEEMNYAVKGFTTAGLKGRKGNQEYFFLLEYGKKESINDKMITDENEI
ncbi:MAG: TlyA family RNA methyltransferase [bacterium]|nr:TlyA family RNA methyltransferase [bacterium]